MATKSWATIAQNGVRQEEERKRLNNEKFLKFEEDKKRVRQQHRELKITNMLNAKQRTKDMRERMLDLLIDLYSQYNKSDSDNTSDQPVPPLESKIIRRQDARKRSIDLINQTICHFIHMPDVLIGIVVDYLESDVLFPHLYMEAHKVAIGVPYFSQFPYVPYGASIIYTRCDKFIDDNNNYIPNFDYRSHCESLGIDPPPHVECGCLERKQMNTCLRISAYIFFTDQTDRVDYLINRYFDHVSPKYGVLFERQKVESEQKEQMVDIFDGKLLFWSQRKAEQFGEHILNEMFREKWVDKTNKYYCLFTAKL
jgi:hypothetical protein